MRRLDKFLVEMNFVETRSKAQELISSGAVQVDGKVQTKASFNVADDAKIKILENDILKYVSRGGLKLEKAIKVFNLDFNNKVILDIGSSTGGFTDCALQNGASRVVAVDVGSDLMHKSLRENSRVELFENTNIKDLDKEKFKNLDFVVVDVSFVGLEHIVKKISEENIIVDMICLIKPQFECGKEIAEKYNGVIKSKTIHKNVLSKVLKTFNRYNFYLQGLDFSPIKGGDGNIEYISHFSNKADKNIVVDIDKVVNSSHN